VDALDILAPGDLRVGDFPPAAVGPTQMRARERAGGTCGSDLHDHEHSGFGTVRIKEPVVLGHEVGGSSLSADRTQATKVLLSFD